MRSIMPLLTTFSLLTTLVAVDLAHADVRLLVPAFDGPSSLGENVSTFLAMQIWTGLRSHPTPNPLGLDFGSGEVDWSRDALAEPTEEYALAAAHSAKRDLVLWGSAFRFGSGVVVQAYLSVADETSISNSGGKWSIKNEGLDLDLFLPDRNFSFSPMILPDTVTRKYLELEKIPLCTSKEKSCEGPPLNRISFKALVQEGDYALIQQNNAKGWVYIPNLSEARGEVVNFSNALIAYVRGDFQQSERRFSQVASSAADSQIRFDALVLAGISQTRLGNDGTSVLRKALEINPYSRYVVQALIMSDLTVALRRSSHYERAEAIADAARLFRSYRHLFDANEVWIDSLSNFMLRSGCSRTSGPQVSC